MRKIALIALFFTLCSIGAFSQDRLQILATVKLARNINEKPITVGMLLDEIKEIETMTREPITPEERIKVLDIMINNILILQAAERDKVKITNAEINMHLNQMRMMLSQQYGRQLTESEFDQFIRVRYNMTMDAYREQLRNNDDLLMETYLNQKKRLSAQLEAVKVPTDAEIADYFNELKKKTPFERPETVKLTMIIVPFGQDASSRLAARQKAESLHKEIGSNLSKFDEIAAKGVTPNAGYIRIEDFVPNNRMGEAAVGSAFIKAAFSLKQGQVSGVIESVHGYCIFKVTENHSKKNLDLDDFVQLGSTRTLKAHVAGIMYVERQQKLIEQVTNELLTDLRKTATINIHRERLNW